MQNYIQNRDEHAPFGLRELEENGREKIGGIWVLLFGLIFEEKEESYGVGKGVGCKRIN